jgi:hypothetical protein
MKQSITDKTTYMGAGAGITLFVVFGIVPGIFLGWALGVTIANMLFGSLPNADTFISFGAWGGMLLGITVGGAVFLMASSALGWLVGAILRKSGFEKCRPSDSAQGTGVIEEGNRDACPDKMSGGAGLTPHHAG